MSQTPETTIPEAPQAPASREGSSRYAQEKVMFGLVVVFFAGVAVLTLVPKAFTGLAMGLIMTATVFAMFRFK